jgi:predicted cupin superfamily sugar epimerase
MPTAQELIKLLGLQPLPIEGGYFVETYRSSLSMPPELPGDAHVAERSLATAIYFLLTTETCSRLHRLKGPEIYHFYLGDPAEMLLLKPDGTAETPILGADLTSGMRPQLVVPGGVWQGARVQPGGAHGYALMGTTMSPGFSVDDFERGDEQTLVSLYPKCAEEIRRLS